MFGRIDMGLFFNNKKDIYEKCNCLNKVYAALKEVYPEKNISDERKEELSAIIKKYGYLPYPYVKALEELRYEEILFGLKIKWEQNGIFDGEKFNFTDNNVSVLARNNIKNSEWIQKEGLI